MLIVTMSVLLQAAQVSIAAPGANCVRLDPAVCDSYVDRFAAQLGADGRVKVVTARDVAAVLGMERQRQLLGCSDDSSNCTAEIAGALGVDGVLMLNVTRSEDSYVLTLRILKSNDGSVWAQASDRVASETKLFDQLDLHARRFLNVLTGQPIEATTSAGVRAAPIVVAGLGVIGIAGGLGLYFGGAKATEKRLLAKEVGASDVSATVQSGRNAELAAGLMMGIGGAALVGGVLWWLVQKSDSGVTVVLTGDGALFAWAGAW